MKYEAIQGDIVLYQEDFDLAQTLDCGQAFRWKCDENGIWSGYYLDRYLELYHKKENVIVFKNTSEEDFLNIWSVYFDLDTDYSVLKKRFSEDDILKNACDFAGGIRLLRQDSWEALCSFIISQNNNIPRIKGIISRMCEKYDGFPSPEALAKETPESLAFLRAGFRAGYIIDAVQKVLSGETDLDSIRKMPYEEAKKQLMKIKGVGPKVADCVLLFGMYRTEAFPVDVWIKKVMANFYPDGMPECTKGYEGIAQQYLFHYARNNSHLLEK